MKQARVSVALQEIQDAATYTNGNSKGGSPASFRTAQRGTPAAIFRGERDVPKIDDLKPLIPDLNRADPALVVTGSMTN